MAGSAAKRSFFGLAGNGDERRFKFVHNPTTGALEILVDLRLKVEHALRAEVRRLQLRLYLRSAFLDLLQFNPQVRSSATKIVSKLRRQFAYPRRELSLIATVMTCCIAGRHDCFSRRRTAISKESQITDITDRLERNSKFFSSACMQCCQPSKTKQQQPSRKVLAVGRPHTEAD
jgi:hypothetical protein